MDRRPPRTGVRGATAALLGVLLATTGCVSKGSFTEKSRELDLTAAALTQERQKNGDIERRLAEATAERDRLASELATSRGEAARLGQQLAETTTQRENLARQLALTQDAASQKDGNLRQLTTRYDGLIKDLERQKAELSGKVNDLAGRLAEAESRVASLTGDLGSTRRDLIAVEQDLASARGVLATTREELAATRQDLGQTQEQLAERERKLQEATATYDKLVADLKSEITDGQVKITRLRDKLTVNLVDKILFDSGSIAIKPRGKEVLLKVAQVLKTVKDKRIQIDGHTDDVPIRGSLKARFPTNWELSTSRATVVARFLQEQGQVDPARLVAAGYGKFRPVATNDTPEGRAENRRIEIVLLPIVADTPM